MDVKNIVSCFLSSLLNEKNVSRKDLEALLGQGLSVESFIDCLALNFGFFLHGSTEIIGLDQLLRTNENGKLFLTNCAAVSILKAIFSNRGANLQYPMRIDERSPMRLKVGGTSISNAYVGNGHVYVVRPPADLRNDPKGSWQYVSSEDVPFIFRVEIEKQDFLYPVE